MTTPELLGYILDHCSRQDLHSACKVSQLWSAVVGAFTHFSTLVIFNPGSSAGLSKLARDINRGSQRRVLVWIPRVSVLHSQEVLSIVGQHINRIAGLAISQLSTINLEHVWRTIQLGAPQLRELILHSLTLADKHQSAPKSFTFGALTLAAPQLRRLVCSGVTISGPYNTVHLLEVVEFFANSAVGHEIAQSLWLAPWDSGVSVNGLAVREHCESGRRATWIATGWAGQIALHNLSETELTSSGVRKTLGHDSTRYRRLMMNEGLRRVAFNDALTVVSIPLYFWGIVRAELGNVHLPRLEVLHLLLVELGDDGVGSGQFFCPNLVHMVLQVDQVKNVDEEEWPWEQFVTCTSQDLAELVQRIVGGTERAVVDLLADGFEVSGPENKLIQIRSRPDVRSFQQWLAGRPRERTQM